jgi:hypothetical protein
MLNNFIDILVAPNQVFGRLKEKPTWFLPLLLVFLMTASVQLGFFSLVDSEYLLDQLVEQSLQPGITERDLRATLQVQVDNKTLLIFSSVIGVLIGLLLVMAIKAAYFLLISKLTDKIISYKSWYSLVAWCSVPSIFTALAAWLVIFSSGRMIDIEALNPLNLNYLTVNTEGVFSSWLRAIDLIAIWGLVLVIMGYQSFTSCSTTKASIIVLTPYILIFGIWAISIVF